MGGADDQEGGVSLVDTIKMTTKNLLVELFVEELPPKALKKLGEAFASALADSLKSQGLTTADSVVTHFASPRRLAAHVTGVLAQAADKSVSQKLMPVSVGLDLSGLPTQALIRKMQALGIPLTPLQQLAQILHATPEQQMRDALEGSPEQQLLRALDGKVENVYLSRSIEGVSLATGLQKALEDAIAKLPIPKVMSYQLESGCELPGWTSVSFVRPAHGLLALHGADVVPVNVLGLNSGNTTQGHRFEAALSPVVISDADSYAATLLKDGAVIASFAERRAEIVRQLSAAAVKIGGGVTAIDDDALLDEVTALVERPNVLVCEFEKEFLDVPQECLILTMKANQKYFPLLDASGKLTNKFLVVSNISPVDASAVIQGNERVVRPRLADAKFFFDQDRKKTLESRVEGLNKVVYHNKLGSQGKRTARVVAIANEIAKKLYINKVSDNQWFEKVESAARLAKCDLLTDMVGEFPELQGIMGGYYALHNGLNSDIAEAIEDHYKPRFAGDELPRNEVGAVVALADKLETLVGMFGIGNLPTGDKDPFALRRHALGVVRMLAEGKIYLSQKDVLEMAVAVFPDDLIQKYSGKEGAPLWRLIDIFINERAIGYWKGVGYSEASVNAVLEVCHIPGDFARRLDAVRAFAVLPEASALAAANKRISNILKKTDAVDPYVSERLLKEPAEIALYAALQDMTPKALLEFQTANYTASLQTLAALRAPVDAFFQDVMVNAEQLDLRLNRLGLLTALHAAMNRVADLSKLAS
jgi:glycyl-tRNA synthetase beta chain